MTFPRRLILCAAALIAIALLATPAAAKKSPLVKWAKKAKSGEGDIKLKAPPEEISSALLALLPAAADASAAPSVQWARVIHRAKKQPTRLLFATALPQPDNEKEYRGPVASLHLVELTKKTATLQHTIELPRPISFTWTVGQSIDVDADGRVDTVLRWGGEHLEHAVGGWLVARTAPGHLWFKDGLRREGTPEDSNGGITHEVACFVPVHGLGRSMLVLQLHKFTSKGNPFKVPDTAQFLQAAEDGTFVQAELHAGVYAERKGVKTVRAKWAEVFALEDTDEVAAGQAKGGACPAVGVFLPDGALGRPPNAGARKFTLLGPFGSSRAEVNKAVGGIEGAPKPLGVLQVTK